MAHTNWECFRVKNQGAFKMTEQEIKDGAPSGASHYDGEEYWQYHNDKWWVYSHYYKLWEKSKPTINDLVSIV